MEHQVNDGEDVDIFYDVLTELEDIELEELPKPQPTVDSELEEFFQRLAEEGSLSRLREQGKTRALHRKDSLISIDREMSSSDFSTEMSSESDEMSNVTDLDDQDKEVEPMNKQAWKLNLPLRLTSKANGSPGDAFNDASLNEEGPFVSEEDLSEFCAKFQDEKFLNSTDGWSIALEKSSETFSYISWARDPLNNEATQFFSRMTIHDCPVEVTRDFLLDENFRMEWDNARLSFSTLEEWDELGRQVASWVRKLPFFLRDREYLVSRRVWILDDASVICIAKSTTHPSFVKKPNTWAVSSFTSCWRAMAIKNAESGKLSCEITNFHQEDSGFPRNWAKMVVMRNLWPYMVRMEKALREYHKAGRNLKHVLPVFVLKADANQSNDDAE